MNLPCVSVCLCAMYMYCVLCVTDTYTHVFLLLRLLLHPFSPSHRYEGPNINMARVHAYKAAPTFDLNKVGETYTRYTQCTAVAKRLQLTYE